MPPKLVLCTDLDGTFLGSPGREELYDAIRQHREDVLLVFATGRALDSVQKCMGESEPTGPKIPDPDYIICEVGTKIFRGRPPHESVASVQSWVRDSWGGASARVRKLLAGVPGLTLQGQGKGWETPDDGSPRAENRVSYYFDETCDVPATCEKVREAGLDPVASHGRFLDVLPRGVAKGPTLLKLVAELGLDPSTVVVAGDSYNDLSLFQVCGSSGVRGVVVGNSQDDLRGALGPDPPGVHYATAHGAAGIAEGLEHHNFSWLSGA
eukprot:TRINITY_DN44667_c0_g1_i1.p1 TRINITY_DN44667_c0_g1~~TRINITY_DN44667_c0_g1_i1.p1  ORF type:complete len:267 (+),score=62.20 TRINITY_DN44667_c0_g1_i1:57-857(+)